MSIIVLQKSIIILPVSSTKTILREPIEWKKFLNIVSLLDYLGITGNSVSNIAILDTGFWMLDKNVVRFSVALLVLSNDKLQISSTKFQINLKSQNSMTKTV
jgi:hypothetical protein